MPRDEAHAFEEFANRGDRGANPLAAQGRLDAFGVGGKPAIETFQRRLKGRTRPSSSSVISQFKVSGGTSFQPEPGTFLPLTRPINRSSSVTMLPPGGNDRTVTGRGGTCSTT